MTSFPTRVLPAGAVLGRGRWQRAGEEGRRCHGLHLFRLNCRRNSSAQPPHVSNYNVSRGSSSVVTNPRVAEFATMAVDCG